MDPDEPLRPTPGLVGGLIPRLPKIRDKLPSLCYGNCIICDGASENRAGSEISEFKSTERASGSNMETQEEELRAVAVRSDQLMAQPWLARGSWRRENGDVN